MEKSRKNRLIMVLFLFFLGSCSNAEVDNQDIEEPEFKEVSVHDPSIIKSNKEYYIIGSHLGFAKSNDLIQWEHISENVSNNTLFEDVKSELAESFNYANTDTLWASDIIQLSDGRYYLYYCFCEGSSPVSTLGVAVADDIEGPYEDLGVFLKSGIEDLNGESYDATTEPNVIDPHVFYDNDGKLWMVYGSYSGGIFILEMDEETALPIGNQGYGKKLLGGNHSRIEAPYILYNKDTEYYYLFLSYGGLDSYGGYNIRVSRSKNPNGPYYDSEGHDMLDAKGAEDTYFDDLAIENYGAKLIGNFQFHEEDELTKEGYVSPGHNSAYYDEEKNAYFILFHTRFPTFEEYHEVRVHQLFFNDLEWPVIAPLRYAGETISSYSSREISGGYSMINHGKDITSEIKHPSSIQLNKNGTIEGELVGTWSVDENNSAKITIDDVVYTGIFILQWDDYSKQETMAFTAMSEEGVTIFGIQE